MILELEIEIKMTRIIIIIIVMIQEWDDGNAVIHSKEIHLLPEHK